MTKRVKAAINPAVLTWARKAAGYELDAIAAKLDLDVEDIASWEAIDGEQPSIPQLRRLAEAYKRPLALFYLPEPPVAFQPMHDFRRLPELGLRHYSPDLTYEIRLAQQRRTLALELAEAAEDKPRPFLLSTTIGADADEVGVSIRQALGVTYELQTKWRGDVRAAFLAWRTRIEEAGVLVFQASRIESDEASGFAYWSDQLPFMVVNRKDVYARRSFSLLHELAHLMLRQSGVSDLDPEGVREAGDERIETFCNQVAAATLMPRALFAREGLVQRHEGGRESWTDAEIAALATVYTVSREAVVRRLLTLGWTTPVFYTRKRVQYAVEFQRQRQEEKERNANKPIPRNMPRETVQDFGRPLVRRVLEQYHLDRITLSEVSGYLNVKTRHVPGIEHLLAQ